MCAVIYNLDKSLIQKPIEHVERIFVENFISWRDNVPLDP